MRDTKRRGESVSEHAGKSSIAANKKWGAQPVPPWSRRPPLPHFLPHILSQQQAGRSRLLPQHSPLSNYSKVHSQDVHCLRVANVSLKEGWARDCAETARFRDPNSPVPDASQIGSSWGTPNRPDQRFCCFFFPGEFPPSPVKGPNFSKRYQARP